MLDYTPSMASIIPDDADDAVMLCMLAMRNKGLTGSERNESQRNCTKMKRALERNRDAGKCKGRT